MELRLLCDQEVACRHFNCIVVSFLGWVVGARMFIVFLSFCVCLKHFIHCEFKASNGYTVSSRAAWTTKTLSQKTKNINK